MVSAAYHLDKQNHNTKNDQYCKDGHHIYYDRKFIRKLKTKQIRNESNNSGETERG